MRRASAVLSLTVLFVSILTCQRRAIPRPEIVYPFEDGLGVFCTAPAGTELRYVVDWCNGMVDTTEQSFAVCDTALMPVRRDLELNVELRVKAISADDPTLESDWASNRIRVATPGMVLWYWVSPNEDSAPPITAPVIGNRDGHELVYVGSDDEYLKVYGIDVETGAAVVSGTGILPEEGYEWIAHPVWNTSTGHLLVPKEDGEFYAFSGDLGYWVWHYPGKIREEQLLPHEWCNMCISEGSIFIPCLDTIIRGNDTIQNVTKFYKIRDSTHMPVHPPFTVLGVQEVRGAPVVDSDGSIYFVTDSGNLFKMNSNIQVQWQKRITQRRGVYGPVIGAAGVVFSGDEDGKAYAYNPDGTQKWTATLSGVREMYMVVGAQYLYAACDNGHVHALDPATGSPVWDKRVSTDAGFETYPALAANGVIYAQDDDGVLFCVRASNGDSLWATDCAAVYPGRHSARRTRRFGLDDPPASPTIASSGNVIVATRDALYCVLGSSRGQLEPDAPWPKWQRDIHNTGCMPHALGQATAW